MKTHQVSLDKLEAQKPFHKTFKKCIGSGRVDLALREEYMDNLRIIQQEIGFEQIRGHGILGDLVGVYHEKQLRVNTGEVIHFDKPLYTFRRAFKIIDNWLSAGIDPILELGFMPGDLAEAHDRHVFWWYGNVSGPKDFNKWYEMIAKFTEAVVERYGEEQVSQWPFEIWNEPNCNFFQPLAEDKKAAYFELYRVAVKAIKDTLPSIKVGGPATQGDDVDWLTYLSENCTEQNVPLDFISHHLYSTTKREPSGEVEYMSLSPLKKMYGRFEKVIETVTDSKHPQAPIDITEWNTSWGALDPVHDNAINAAYIAPLLVHLDGKVRSFSYWTFCDVFEEQGIPKSPFHGGFGLMTEEGLRKPTYWAFEFANRLGNEVLHFDEHLCITRNRKGKIAILSFNPCITKTEASSVSLEVSLKLAWNTSRIVSRHVNDEQGNAYQCWRKLGMPRHPSDEEIEILSHAQYPALEIERKEHLDSTLQLSMNLQENGISLTTIEPFVDHSDEYIGRRATHKEVAGQNYA